MPFFDVLRYDRDKGTCLHDRNTPSPLPFTQKGVPEFIKSTADALHRKYACDEVTINLSTLNSSTESGVLAYYNQLKRSDSKGVVEIYALKHPMFSSITEFFQSVQTQPEKEGSFQNLALVFEPKEQEKELQLLSSHKEFLIFFIKNEYVIETNLSQSPSAFLNQLTPRRYSSDRSNSCDSPRLGFS